MNAIKLEKKGKIAILRMSRPEKLNAMDAGVLDELEELVDEINRDPEVIAVIITGEGKAFVAGADISELATLNGRTGYEKMRRGQSLFDKIERSPKVWIAAINGFALGGGLELALSCDIRLASETAKMGQPEVNLGIIPGYGGTQRLVRSVGLGWAKYMILSGRMITASEAMSMGLVQGAYPAEELMAKAEELAGEIASKGPLALASAKRSVYNAVNMPMNEGLEEEARLFGELCETADSKEGLTAFLEKRKAEFKGQ
ncbi:MAG: enoyl-CoA hydratase-related protein [candidate division WOR-3 bacterium]